MWDSSAYFVSFLSLSFFLPLILLVLLPLLLLISPQHASDSLSIFVSCQKHNRMSPVLIDENLYLCSFHILLDIGLPSRIQCSNEFSFLAFTFFVRFLHYWCLKHLTHSIGTSSSFVTLPLIFILMEFPLCLWLCCYAFFYRLSANTWSENICDMSNTEDMKNSASEVWYKTFTILSRYPFPQKAPQLWRIVKIMFCHLFVQLVFMDTNHY